jgi:hypothetical protein
MPYFVLSVIGIVAVLLVRAGWSRSRQILFILIGIIAGLVVYLVIDIGLGPGTIQKGPAAMFGQIPWLEISLYFIMLLGMAAKFLFDAIGHRKTVTFNKWQLLKPVLVSPMVFAAIYSSIGKDGPSVLLLIFSFQNGFFWQSVLKK